jgi:menaquinone-9 beta-reductase
MTDSETAHHHSLAQPPADQIEKQLWDVAVIGAGPAGSTVATLLARQNHRVLLVDRAHFPREKVCGDILLPDTIRALKHLGLFEQVASAAHPLKEIRGVSTGGTSFVVAGNYYSLQRSLFDAQLVRESVTSGAVFCRDDALTVSETDESGVTISFRSGTTAISKIVVLATGADALLAQRSGVTGTSKVNAVALRCYVHSDYAIEEGILCYHKEIAPGYAWIFPLGNNTYNVGCGVTLSTRKQYHLKQMFETFATEYEPARLLMKSPSTRTHLIGAAIRFGLYHPEEAVDGRRIAIGESIGTTLPFTGEGIGTAMRSAELAAESIHDALVADNPALLASYPSKLREFRPLFDGYEAAQRWLRIPLFNDLAARRIKASKYLQELCAGVLAGEISPRQVYSLGGILKSFWK